MSQIHQWIPAAIERLRTGSREVRVIPSLDNDGGGQLVMMPGKTSGHLALRNLRLNEGQMSGKCKHLLREKRVDAANSCEGGVQFTSPLAPGLLTLLSLQYMWPRSESWHA